jgi:3-phosphoshikimate 1-carboxyvinyltransferase
MTENANIAVFRKIGALKGTVRVPGDKSLSHRALILAGLTDGTSHISGLSDGDDVARTREALEAYGVGFAGDAVTGGRAHLREPERPLDMGNSGTAMRLLSGVAASLPFLSVFIGDASLHRRPMDRIVEPLREMGATIDGRASASLAPLCIRGGELQGIDYRTSVPSAQVKGSILLAGLGAKGETVVREAIPTRRHTEELLALAGVATTSEEKDGLFVARMTPTALRPFSFEVPGDPSQAAFLAVAASIIEGSDVTIERVYVGHGRAGFIDALRNMGASIDLHMTDDDVADMRVRYAPLRATHINGSAIPSLIDEIPALAIAAFYAKGTTIVRDAAELRLKESDRIETVAMGLRALGGEVETFPDGIAIHGGGRARSARIHSAGDHRIAMAFALAGLAGDGEVCIDGFSSVATSWPGFRDVIEALS